MNEMLQWPLKEGETLTWQGRPAPRCYTFRHWLQALIGTVLFLASSFWLMVGIHLIRADGVSIWILPVPILLVVGSFLIGPMQVILARIRWEKIYYALTEQRLLVRNNLFGEKVKSFDMSDYRRYKIKKYGKKLKSVRVSFEGGKHVVLECLEHPELLFEQLPASNQAAIDKA